MKKLVLTAMSAAIAAGSSSVAIAGSASLAPAELFDGTPARTHHIVSGDSLYSLSNGGTAVPKNNGGSYGASVSGRSLTDDLWNTTVTCTGDALDASGNPDPYEADVWTTIVAFPWSGGAGLAPAGGITAANGCQLEMGNTGEITGGWNVADPFPIGGGSFVISTFLYDAPRVGVTTIGATCPQGPAAIPLAQAARTDLFNVLDAGGSLGAGFLDFQPNVAAVLPAGCNVFGLVRQSIGNCDPFLLQNDCTPTSSKAVPVPAFAAGALALGLAGVTYLTSRRRTLK